MSGVSNDSNRSFLNCDKEFEYLLWLLAGGESMTTICIIVVTDIIYVYVIVVNTLSLFLSDAIEECKVKCMLYFIILELL